MQFVPLIDAIDPDKRKHAFGDECCGCEMHAEIRRFLWHDYEASDEGVSVLRLVFQQCLIVFADLNCAFQVLQGWHFGRREHEGIMNVEGIGSNRYERMYALVSHGSAKN